MRLLFFALFAFFTCAVSAQRTIVKDSSWLTNVQGTWIQSKLVVYDSGQRTLNETPLGDTLATANYFQKSFESVARSYALDANIIIQNRSEIIETTRFGSSIKLILGISPLDSIRNAQKNLFDATGWKINNTGVRFRVNGTGQFQWRADTTTNWRTSFYLGDVIVLNNFQGLKKPTLFAKNGKQWRSLNTEYVITQPASTAQVREVLDAPIQEEEQPKNQQPIFNKDGTVFYGDKSYLYNKSSKSWIIKSIPK